MAGVIYLIFFSVGGAAKNYDANISLRIHGSRLKPFISQAKRSDEITRKAAEVTARYRQAD
jgi:hypothetical protein